MTEAVAVPSDPGLVARAIGILTSPRATFEKVVANPRPVGILFLVAVVIALGAGIAADDRGGPASLARHAGPADGALQRAGGDARAVPAAWKR